MRIEFDKMQGAGNDFILIDNRRGAVPDADKRRLAVAYCRRCFGIGADGMIFVENDPEFDFAWDFYNPDGSKAEMCGNGARCVARFANRIGAAGETMTFRSLAGPIEAELTELGAKVRLTDTAIPAGSERLAVDEDFVDVWFANTGVPHAVVRVPDLERVDVRRLGSLLRYHARFQPAGTNVNFFSPVSDHGFAIRTYERGVEDETMACGTGSVATSIIAGCFFGMASPITASTRGGGELVIHFTVSGSVATDIYLEGGAARTFSGAFDA